MRGRAAVLALIPVALAACNQAPAPVTPAISARATTSPIDQDPVFTGGANQMEVTLFFIRTDGEALAPEKRRIFRTATTGDRARQAIQALLDGSETGLLPPIPQGTLLREIYLTRDGTAYVDVGEGLRGSLETGTSDAVYAVYAIVNTLVQNFPEIEKVKILVEGDEVEDAGGHFNLARPILPEMSLVSRAPARVSASVHSLPPSVPSPDPNAPLPPQENP